MPAVRRATIANDLTEQIGGWLSVAGHYASPDDLTFKSFLKAAEKLANTDAYEASVVKALVHHLAGDLDESNYWLSNARKWPNDPDSVQIEAVVLSNLGFFSRTAELLVRVGLRDRGEPFVSVALLSGAWRLLAEDLPGSSFADTEGGLGALDLAQRCIMTMEQVNVTEAQVQAVLDVAGSVLRRHRLFFAGQRPVVRIARDIVLYQLQVNAPPELTVAMTDEVIHEMVEKDLDVNGLAFSFIPV